MENFSKDKYYNTGDIVLYNGTIYQAKAPSWGIEPNAPTWDVVTDDTIELNKDKESDEIEADSYDATKYYQSGDVVKFASKIYRANAPIWGQQPPSPAWDIYSDVEDEAEEESPEEDKLLSEIFKNTPEPEVAEPQVEVEPEKPIPPIKIKGRVVILKEHGYNGIDGRAGSKGDKGDAGPQGPQGIPGKDGTVLEPEVIHSLVTKKFTELSADSGGRDDLQERIKKGFWSLGGGGGRSPKGTRSVKQGSFYYQTPAAVTIPLVSSSRYPVVINGLYNLTTSSGTIDITVKKNGVNITGLSNITVTSSPQTILATALNSLAIGDRLTLVLANNSSSADLEFTMKATA